MENSSSSKLCIFSSLAIIEDPGYEQVWLKISNCCILICQMCVPLLVSSTFSALLGRPSQDGV